MLHRTLTSSVAALAVAILAAGVAQAAELPKATQALLAKKHLSADELSGLDAELKVPPEWIAGAKKEGTLIVGATWDSEQFDVLAAPFRERYPFIKIEYFRASRYDRVIKPLIAYKQGRVLADVLTGVADKYPAFKKANALLDLRRMPNWKNVQTGMKGKNGDWIGARLRYWCMSYNTSKVAKKDLPATWDDLLKNKKFRNGKIGMGNRPNLWLLAMWDDWGERRIQDYARQLFGVVKPQLRKEGMNALISLTAAGEFDIALPSAAYRVSQLVAKGAPLSWHCPAPVPTSVSDIVGIRGGHENAALLFINWFESKEGQVAQFAANNAPPIHKDMQRREFLAFPDEILGKKIAFREPEALEGDLKKLMKFWNPLWFSGRGIKLDYVTAKLEKVGRKGRNVTFKVKGKKQKAKISGSRTSIEIDGDEGARADLKPGMTCEIGYPGNNEEAVSIACKK